MSSIFIQAEDGMRVLTVTGVQTCALPILKLELVSLYEDFFIGMEEGMWSAPASSSTVPRRFAGIPFWLQQASATAVRSEERRVGKEAGAGWSPAGHQTTAAALGHGLARLR